MTTEQPLALKLADGLTDMWGGYEFPGEDFEQQAAAELRRLHAENNLLKMSQYGSGRLQALRAQRDELLAALLTARDHIDMEALEISHCKDAERIRAAIAKVEAGK